MTKNATIDTQVLRLLASPMQRTTWRPWRLFRLAVFVDGCSLIGGLGYWMNPEMTL